MTITYQLSENDFLQYHLFNATKSARIKKQRRRSWFFNVALIFSVGFISFLNNNHFLVYYFLIAGALMVCFQHLFLRWYYKNHYKKVVKDSYKNKVEELCTITFSDDFIESVDRTGTAKINTSEMEKIYETGHYFFLRLKTNSTLIIPKSEIVDIEYLRNELKKLSEKTGAEFICDLNWKWR